MQEAFQVLQRAKREAEARLRKAEAEGAEHKLLTIRHAISELDAGLRALEYMDAERLKLIRLWQQVEEGNRSVQHMGSDTKQRARNARSTGKRRG